MARTDAEMGEIIDNSLVRLAHGSVISMRDLKEMSAALFAAEGERDRARRLAAHLEEVVEMRTAVLRTFVAWFNLEGPMGGKSVHTLAAAFEWAEAQLSEVP